MVDTRSLIQGLLLCATFLIYKLSSIKQQLNGTSMKEGYLSSSPQDTIISDSFTMNTEECTYNVIIKYNGDPSDVKRDDFDVDNCRLTQIVLLSNNKDIVDEKYMNSNVNDTKIVYVYNQIQDVSHLQLAISIYYDVMYSLIIEDLSLFTKRSSLWVYSALKGLTTTQKAAFIYDASIKTPSDITTVPLDRLSISAVFTRTKTIRRLLTSTEIASDGSNALMKLTAFLHCQEQGLRFILLHDEDTHIKLVSTSTWVCDNTKYAISSGCTDPYSNSDVATIISVFRRPYLKEQLLQMNTGTHSLKRIIIYQCLHHLDLSPIIEMCPTCQHFWSLNYDFKLLFRFTFSFSIPEHFILYYSDDIVPLLNLNQKIVSCIQNTTDICGFNGRFLDTLSSISTNYTYVRNNRMAVVDWTVGMYATESHDTRTVFKVRPYTYDYAEDIHLSMASALMCQTKTRAVGTLPSEYKSYSNDQFAIYKTEEGHLLRYQTLRYFIENRFVPIYRLKHILGVKHGLTLTKSDLYYFKSNVMAT